MIIKYSGLQSKTRFKDFERKIEDLESTGAWDLRHDLQMVMAAALDNADYLCVEDKSILRDSEEYFKSAYGSIAQTSEFQDNPEVQKWFAEQGYRW